MAWQYGAVGPAQCGFPDERMKALLTVILRIIIYHRPVYRLLLRKRPIPLRRCLTLAHRTRLLSVCGGGGGRRCACRVDR